MYLRIDRNFCSVHEESADWGYFEWTEQIISINSYKLTQACFAMILKTYVISILRSVGAHNQNYFWFFT
jgi:hypothetical protein